MMELFDHAFKVILFTVALCWNVLAGFVLYAMWRDVRKW